MAKFCILITAVLFFFPFILFSQAPPQGINYQAVARDNSGNPLATQTIIATFRIRQTIPTGTAVYRGTLNTSTNQFGLFTAIIGQTGSDSGSFSTINWGADTFYLQVIVNGNDMGTTQFMSVPYALYAPAGDKDCPAGFAPVNASLCIEISERPAATWFTANTDCGGSIDARLCSAGEWYAACTNAVALGLLNMTNNWEWIDDLSSGTNSFMMGSGACGTTSTNALMNSISYRCCFTR